MLYTKRMHTTMISHKLRKEERLKSSQLINKLFHEGTSEAIYPLRFVWVHLPQRSGTSPIRVAFAVSRKNFKSAVKRNTLKRRMREAWRIHKHQLYDALEDLKGQMALMIIYLGKEEKEFGEIENAVKRAVKNLPKIWLAKY